MSKVRINNLSKIFFDNKTGAVEIIKNISLEIEEESVTTIVGKSGCGKTTFLKLVSGLIPPSSGEVKFDPDNKNNKTRVSFVFQSPALFPWRTVYKNVIFPLELTGYKEGKNKRKKKAEYLIELVGLSDFKHYLPSQISIGMQQRTSIARALVTNPCLLLMDEPFSALDEFTREKMNDELLGIQEKMNTTILFVTHSIQEALYLSKRVVVLSSNPATIKKVVDIPFLYPRQLDVKLSDQFIEKRKELSDLFEK